MSQILFVTLSIYLNAFQTYRPGPLPKPTHISKPSAPPTHTRSHTHAPAKPRPCPCLLAASLHTGSILPGHGLRGAGVCICVWVFKGVLVHTVHRVCWNPSVCVCFVFFGVIMLLTCVQKAQAADGFNACGRLMCAWVFACDSKREGGRRIQHVRMCVQEYSGRWPPAPLTPPSNPAIPPPSSQWTHPHLHPAMLRPVHNVLTEAGLSSPGTGFQNGCNWSVSNYVFIYGWMVAK